MLPVAEIMMHVSPFIGIYSRPVDHNASKLRSHLPGVPPRRSPFAPRFMRDCAPVPTHSQSPMAWVMHIPGMKGGSCPHSTIGKGLLTWRSLSSLARTLPVLWTHRFGGKARPSLVPVDPGFRDSAGPADIKAAGDT